MADYKYPVDGTMKGAEALTANKTITFPEKGRIEEGRNRAFEILIEGATALDNTVSFKIYGSLDTDAFDASNLVESVSSADLTGLTGKLVFKRDIIDTLDVCYKIVISGTNTESTATFVIRGRSL